MSAEATRPARAVRAVPWRIAWRSRPGARRVRCAATRPAPDHRRRPPRARRHRGRRRRPRMADRPTPRPAAMALSRPGVDGVLGTPDISTTCPARPARRQVVVGSMNRGGLQGAAFEMDDRFTGYDASLAARASTSPRCSPMDLADPGTASTLEACARR